MSITIYNHETEYKVRDDFEYHLGKKSLDIMAKYHDRIHQYNFTDDIAETHGSVRLRSIRVAQALTKQGIGLNDVIMMSGPNHNDVSIPLIASLFIGATAFPIHNEQTKEQANTISKAAAEINLSLEIVVFGDDPNRKFLTFSEFSKPTGTEEDFKTALIDPDDLASDIMLSFANQCWISGSVTVLMSCTLGQSRVQTPFDFTPDLMFEALKKTKPTTILLAPMLAARLVAHPDFQKTDFSSAKLVVVVGSALSDDLRQQLQKRIPNGRVNNNYGMTECVGPLSVIPVENTKPKTIGLVLPWIQWRVANVDTGEFLGPHAVGELQVIGDTIFKEYFKNPEATENAFTSDKWYQTGDLVYYDEDNYIFTVDRIKEIIKWDSKQIAPAEIEHLVGEIEGVAAVCVVGIPDGLIGDLPLAFVQKAPGSKVTAQQIKDVVRDSLSDWKRLRGGVAFLDSIPLTYSGKVDRKFLNQIKSSVKAE